MVKRLVVLLVLLFALISVLAPSAHAYSYYVKGYYRSNGTYVNGYYRTSPNYYKSDNYSYRPSQPRYNSSYTSPRSNYRYSKGWSTPSYYSKPSDYSNSTYRNRPYSTWGAGYEYNY